MAYVGTPRRLGSARDTLASIIQGEAGGEGLRGMQAVGQVIQNRAAVNYSGYGSDLVSQATARKQFQGQAPLSRVSPNAYAVADQMLDGTLPNVVGSGAVNYAVPRDSTPGNWGSQLNSSNAFKFGNHYFTDNTNGIPYNPDLSSPVNSNNPTGVNSSSGLSAPGTVGGVSNPAPTGNYYYNPQTGAITPTTDTVYPGTDPAMNIDAEKGILYSAGTGPGASGAASMGGGGAGLGGFDSTGGFTGANVGMGGMGNGSTPSVTGLGAPGNGNPNGYSLDGATLNPNVTASNVADPVVGYNAAGPVMGAPTVTAAINQSGQKVSGSVDKGAKQIGDDTKQAGQTIGKSIDGTSSTLKGISDSWQALGKDYFLRVAFVIVGLIALAAGLMLFKPVQNAAGAVLTKIPKVPV